MFMKACLNGPRSRAEHPALPMTAAELAADARAVQEAGVDAVHVHVKDADGADTCAAARVEDVVGAIRRAAPGLPVGVSTGAWMEPDAGRRAAAVRSWTVLPDFASVNWHEEGAERVAAALLERGVGVEAGLWHAAAAWAWARSDLRERCLRVLLELPDGLDGEQTRERADLMVEIVDTVPMTSVVLHGEGTSTWPALRHAGRRGLGARIGLEDTLCLPDGGAAGSNLDLALVARQLVAAS